MKRDARQAILEAGARLIYRQGFHNTGLADILAEAQVPKGSFYFYFKSKEDFGLALVDHFTRLLAETATAVLGDTALPPLERMRRMFSGIRERQTKDGCAGGCPIGNLAQEMSGLSPALRAKLQAAMSAMNTRLAGVLAEAQERGELRPGLDPERTAAFVLDAWEGALLRMKVEKSPEPLARFEDFLFGQLLA